MNEAKMLCAAAHGLNVAKALLPAQSAKARRTSNHASFMETLVTVRTRTETVSVSVTKTTAEMTMEEYQDYIWNKIDSFPFSSTRPFDEQTIKISEKCWDRMKDDPEYEEKMMNIIKDGRQYPDPFFGMGSSGAYWVLEFDGGEGCWSHGFSKDFGGSKAGVSSRFDAESEGGFWSSRRKRREQQKQAEQHYLEQKQQMALENQHVHMARLMAQDKFDEAAFVTCAGVPASSLLAGIGGGIGTEL
ncbi:MAG: hypothetical protein IJ631_04440 [Schwartzia sp.]|nr:hypothetical protein [Schwartzia sp. (in: firmicutes)]